MRPDFQIVEARAYHCGAMVRMLRAEHQRAIARLGVNAHRELRQRFDSSSFRRAWLIDGKLAALGGVTGSQLSSEGYVWLALSGLATRYPLEVVRETRRQLAALMVVKRSLVTSIIASDETSKRFAIFMGFVLADDDCMPAASRTGRRAIAVRFDGQHDAHVPLGHGVAVAMKYLPEHQEVA